MFEIVVPESCVLFIIIPITLLFIRYLLKAKNILCFTASLQNLKELSDAWILELALFISSSKKVFLSDS